MKVYAFMVDMLQIGLCFRFEYPYKNDICVRIFSIFADLYIQDTIDSTCFWYNHFSPFHFKLNAQLNYIPWTKPSKGKGDKIKEHIENRLEQSVRTIKSEMGHKWDSMNQTILFSTKHLLFSFCAYLQTDIYIYTYNNKTIS